MHTTGRLRRQFVHFSPPPRFGERYGPQLKQSDNIRVLLNANVVNIALDYLFIVHSDWGVAGAGWASAGAAFVEPAPSNAMPTANPVQT